MAKIIGTLCSDYRISHLKSIFNEHISQEIFEMNDRIRNSARKYFLNPFITIMVMPFFASIAAIGK